MMGGWGAGKKSVMGVGDLLGDAALGDAGCKVGEAAFGEAVEAALGETASSVSLPASERLSRGRDSACR